MIMTAVITMIDIIIYYLGHNIFQHNQKKNKKKTHTQKRNN